MASFVKARAPIDHKDHHLSFMKLHNGSKIIEQEKFIHRFSGPGPAPKPVRDVGVKCAYMFLNGTTSYLNTLP